MKGFRFLTLTQPHHETHETSHEYLKSSSLDVIGRISRSLFSPMLEHCVFHIDAVLQDLEAKTWMEMPHASRHPPRWKEAEMQWTQDQLVLVQEPDSHLFPS